MRINFLCAGFVALGLSPVELVYLLSCQEMIAPA